MTYIRNFTLTDNGTVSADNSTSTPLSSGQSFIGSGEDVTGYGSISVVASVAPKQTASGTLYMEFSPDNITWTLGSGLRQIAIPISPANATNTIHNLIPISKYFRARYENLDVDQDLLNLQTIYNKGARIALPTSRLSQNLSDYNDVLNVRAGLVGKTQGGYWRSVSTNNEGSLLSQISSPTSAFGEVLVSEPTPVSQIDFIYGLNSVVLSSGITGSGTVSSSGSLCFVSTTANASSSATLASRRYLKYRPGQGGLSKFTAVFTTGIADSKQYAGIGDTDLNNGFFFGYDGTSFGICSIKNSSETWIPQTSWNRDLCNGQGGLNNKSGFNLDPTKGNIFEIKYQYLGFGIIKFSIVQPETGLYFPVHIIEYPNSSTETHVQNPSFRSIWKTVNTSNSTNMTVSGGSAALFVEGQRAYLGPKRGVDANKAGVTTETNLITLKNCSTFNGVYNAAYVRLRSVSFGSNTGGTTSGIATLKITKNATLGGSPSWTIISGTSGDSGATITGESVVSYDTAGTTVSGGVVEYNSVVQVGGSDHADITDLDIFMAPGETLTISITSTQSATVGAAVTWSEDI